MNNPFDTRRPRAAVARPIQGELLLDQVQVVRNDLSDADMAVVPAARTKVELMSPALDHRKLWVARVSSGVVWNRFTARLFTVGHRRWE